MAITAPIMVKNLDTLLSHGYSMEIPDSVENAQVRVQTMIDTRYDGMCQKPEVLTHRQMILVVYTGRISDPQALLAQVQAAALNRSMVAH